MSAIGINRRRLTGYNGADQSLIWEQNRKLNAGNVGVLHLPGYGGNADSYLTEVFGDVARRMAQRGFVCFAGDYGGSGTFGNATAVTAIGAAVSWVRAQRGVSGKLHLVGGSMGATNALNYAKRFPAEVASLTLIIPGIDLIDIYTNDRGGYADEISAAYGGAPPTDRNPASWPADVAAIPTRIYYSTNDPICTPTTVTTFGEAVDAEMVSIGDMGHLSIGAIPLDLVADFCWANS